MRVVEPDRKFPYITTAPRKLISFDNENNDTLNDSGILKHSNAKPKLFGQRNKTTTNFEMIEVITKEMPSNNFHGLRNRIIAR